MPMSPPLMADELIVASDELQDHDGGRAIFGSLWVCNLFKAFFLDEGLFHEHAVENELY